jgi:hypothetical protein
MVISRVPFARCLLRHTSSFTSAVAVASDFQVIYGGSGDDRTGVQLLSGEIPESPAGALGFRGTPSEMIDRPPPGGPCIVGAVDAGTIRASQQQLTHRVVVGGVVAGEGHHDADFPFKGLRSEQTGGVLLGNAAVLGMANDIAGTGGEGR